MRTGHRRSLVLPLILITLATKHDSSQKDLKPKRLRSQWMRRLSARHLKDSQTSKGGCLSGPPPHNSARGAEGMQVRALPCTPSLLFFYRIHVPDMSDHKSAHAELLKNGTRSPATLGSSPLKEAASSCRVPCLSFTALFVHKTLSTLPELALPGWIWVGIKILQVLLGYVWVKRMPK